MNQTQRPFIELGEVSELRPQPRVRRAMPRYKFHFTDGKSIVPDDWGMDLRNDEAAIGEAYDMARDLRDAPPDEDWSDWVIEVMDEAGRRVVALRPSDIEPDPLQGLA